MGDENDLEKVYRPSATLIIAAKSDSKEHDYDYRILLAKRSPAIAFAPLTFFGRHI
ncbi:hypothetical protein DOY81_009044 [Sarcophaga bullata]|nr:hypothetical protein DOY81_009044 [Sarcophaga bullata]